MTTEAPPTRQPIAIVGMSALCPGASTTDGFLQVIFDGRDQIRDVPPSRFSTELYFDPDPKSGQDKTYSRRGAFIDAVPFDPMEFGVPPSALAVTDSSQILTLLKAKEVSEDAGLAKSERVSRDRISVIVGAQGMTQLQALMMSRLQWPHWIEEMRAAGLSAEEAKATAERISSHQPAWQEMSFPGFLGNIIAGRVTNRLDFGGSNFIVDAACASSLAAMSAALNELYLHQCDLAITGGADLLTDIGSFVAFCKSQALSPTGDCRPFSADADGTLIGEGVVLFALKRLDDAERDGDPIYAVIRGHGTSSDGRGSAIYAPRQEGQVRAMRRAYEAAGYGAETVGLVEAHGTGTPLGDATEVASMIDVFGGPGRTAPAALGSVKSQIGHAKTSAGAAAMFKVAAALRHKILPPTLKVSEPNEALRGENCPLYLNTETRPWISGADHPRRAALSAFGFGGTNAHLTLEEYVGPGTRMPRRLKFPSQLFLFSAPSLTQLLLAADDAAVRAGKNVPFDGLARETQHAFSTALGHRLGLVAKDAADLRALVDKVRMVLTKTGSLPPSGFDNAAYATGAADPGKIAFMFPGQGSQYVGMTGTAAAHFDAARTPWDEDARRARADGTTPLHSVVFPMPALTDPVRTEQDTRLRATDAAQPALGLASLSLLALLNELGVTADMTFGHSFGEIMALHAAGAFDAATAISLARLRGRVMRDAGKGQTCAMTAIADSAANVEALIAKAGADVVIANLNAPKQVVISGLAAEVAKVEQLLSAEVYRKLPVSSAFHSPIVAAATEPLREALGQTWATPPRLPVFANATGKPYGADMAEAREILASQIAKPVRFTDCVEAAYQDGARVFIEVGASDVLKGLVGKCLEGRPHAAIALDSRKRNGVTALFQALAKVSVLGVPVAFDALWADRKVEDAVEPPPLKKHVVWVDSTIARLTEQDRLAGKTAQSVQPPKAQPPKVQPREAPVPKMPIRLAPTLSVAARRESPTPPPSGGTIKMPPAPQLPRAAEVPPPVAVNARIKGAQSPSLTRLMEEVTATQEQFLSTVLESHKAFLEMTRGALRGANDAAPVPVLRIPEVIAPEPVPRMPEPPAVEPEIRVETVIPPAPVAAPAPSLPPILEATAIAVPEPRAAAMPSDLGAVVIDIIAEKTGYPSDMIEPAMELEGDLGVDSIRRVEIFMALRARVPGLPEPGQVDPAQIGQLKTVADITAFLAKVTGGSTAPAPGVEAPIEMPVRMEAPAQQPISASKPVAPDLSTILLSVIADKTGYPPDMLSLDMELEADLGVDSIKRVEILLALRERLPGLLPDAGQVDVSVLGRLKTLGDVLALLSDPSALAKPGAKAAEETRTEPAVAAPAPLSLDSFAVVLREAPQPMGSISFRGRPVHIVADSLGVAEALRIRLSAYGVEAVLGLEGAADVANIVCLAGLANSAGPDVALPAHVAAFQAAKRLAMSGAREGVFVTVQDTGGSFGLDSDPGANAWLGGLAGMTKTVGKCLPHVRVKAIDIDTRGRTPAAIANVLAAELLAQTDAIEIAIDAEGNRRTPELVRARIVEGQPLAGPALDARSVIVVSGGARGVTAACLEALAHRHRPRFVILGRTPLAEEGPETLGAEDDAQLKRALLEAARASGATLKPADIGKKAAAIAATREVKACLVQLAALGSEARYVALDVRDAGAVTHALADTRAQWGPITGLIHAAGVLADKLLVDKTEAQFTGVFATKVEGLASLLAATEGDPLKFIFMFSSVAARFGNVGQIDYAAANEVLNKVAQAESRRRGPSCLVKSINWGAWAGGMVSPELARHMEAASVDLIPLDRGAQFMADCLAATHTGAVEIVATPESNLKLLQAPPPRIPSREALSPQAAE